jgi:hypothetical protein
MQAYTDSLTQFWGMVWGKLAQVSDARGAPPLEALLLFTDNTDEATTFQMLQQLKAMKKLCVINREALRKAVKKYDKIAMKIPSSTDAPTLPTPSALELTTVEGGSGCGSATVVPETTAGVATECSTTDEGGKRVASYGSGAGDPALGLSLSLSVTGDAEQLLPELSTELLPLLYANPLSAGDALLSRAIKLVRTAVRTGDGGGDGNGNGTSNGASDGDADDSDAEIDQMPLRVAKLRVPTTKRLPAKPKRRITTSVRNTARFR